MYSIYDHDLWRYNYTSLNSKTKIECYMNYLDYRSYDLYDCERRDWDYTAEEVEKRNDKTRHVKFMKRLYDTARNDERMQDDLDCWNFELVKHDKHIEQD